VKRITLILLLALVRCAIGHDMPAQLPEPQSPEEAWTVVEESAGNIDQLMAEKLLRDATFQLANIGTAIQYLSAHANDATAKPLVDRLLGATIELIAALRDHEQPFAKTQAQWLDWRKSLTQLESLYPPAMVHSAVYICPMHPLDRHLSPDEKCTKCSMTLVRRRLPANSVYEKPGEPTMTASVIAPPLVAGKPAEVPSV
jgi:hypothetical protein